MVDMMEIQILRLLQIGVVIVVAVGALWLLLRLSDRTGAREKELLPGYPADLFPVQELTRSGPLLALAHTQARLTSMYRQIPPQSDLAVWLRAFLKELREIMDVAYRVSVITQVYGQPTQLERLIEEVREIETQVADYVVQRLLAREGEASSERLDGRLATLRMCVRELATLAE